MSNLTPTISDILRQTHSVPPIPSTPGLPKSPDAFLAEVRKLQSSISSLLTYLRQIRQPYLSTAPKPRRLRSDKTTKEETWLSDKDRDNIDNSTGELLGSLSTNLRGLTELEQGRIQTQELLLQKKYASKSFLSRWAGGDVDDNSAKSEEQISEEGQIRQVKVSRQGVLWCLADGIRRCAHRQRELVAVRAERESQREASVLYKRRGQRIPIENEFDQRHDGKHLWTYDDKNGDEPRLTGHHGTVDNPNLHGSSYDPSIDPNSPSTTANGLTSEQMQLFAEENSTMISFYTSQLAAVTKVEKSLLQISDLQNQLVTELDVQGEKIDLLVADADSIDSNVQRGNKELKKATERASTARTVFWATCGLCGFLITWDLVF